MEKQKNIHIFCSKCSLCNKELSRKKRSCILCLQWTFGISVLVLFIATVITVGFLCYFWIGNRFVNNAVGSSHIEETSDINNFSQLQPIVDLDEFVLVNHLLNFTDANEYCKNKGWNFLTTRSKEEEDALQFMEFGHCNSSFVGFRRIISHALQTDDGEPIFGDIIYQRELPDTCIAMVKNYDYNISNAPCELKNEKGNACYVCESVQCSDNQSICFEIHIEFVHSREEANRRCSEQKDSKLAAVVNFSLYEEIRETYRKADPNSTCSLIYLGMSSYRDYESITEEEASYKSERLDSLDVSDDYCVSVTKKIWISADCTQNMCFICRKK